MIDPNDGNKSRREYVERTWEVLKRIQRAHLDSYGKLGKVNTWLLSLAVAVAFLVVGYLTAS